MSKRVLFIAGLMGIGFFLGGCQSDDAVKESENEVFAIHDEVMPKIDKIMKLQKQLKRRISSLDSLTAAGSTAATLRIDEDKEQAKRLSQNLETGYNLMMDWMNHYNGDTLPKLSTEEALKYLAAQKDQITDVKTKVNTSIEQTTQFLGKK